MNVSSLTGDIRTINSIPRLGEDIQFLSCEGIIVGPMLRLNEYRANDAVSDVQPESIRVRQATNAEMPTDNICEFRRQNSLSTQKKEARTLRITKGL